MHSSISRDCECSFGRKKWREIPPPDTKDRHAGHQPFPVVQLLKGCVPLNLFLIVLEFRVNSFPLRMHALEFPLRGLSLF